MINAHENEIRSNNSENEIKLSDSSEIATSDFNLPGDEILFSREQLSKEQQSIIFLLNGSSKTRIGFNAWSFRWRLI